MNVELTWTDEVGRPVSVEHTTLERAFDDNHWHFDGMRTAVRDDLRRYGEYTWMSGTVGMVIRRVKCAIKEIYP